jgi:hypothetical protein
METKICSKCKIEKEITLFGNYKRTKDGLRCACKSCESESTKKWRSENKDKTKLQKQRYQKRYPEKNLNRGKIYRDNNKEKEIIRRKKYYTEKPEIRKIYYENNKEVLNKKVKERKNNDPIFKLKLLFRSKTNKILGSNREKTFDIIGCTPHFLKEHLEKKFTEGMNWDNHSLYGWHIDHIIPLSSAKTEEELYKLCHYTNLQPLWAEDNLKKGDRLQ